MFACKCLNVLISNDSRMDPVVIDEWNLAEDELQDEFFQQKLGKIRSECVKIQHKCLMQTHYVGHWLIYRCLNCLIDTHASHSKLGASSVLINLSLKTNSNELAVLQSNDQYSAAFKILITCDIDVDLVRANEDQLNNDQCLMDLQRDFNEAIKNEIECTEKRIKAFSEQEYLKLDSFKDRAKYDYNSLFKTILKNQEKTGVKNSSQLASSVSPVGSNKSIASSASLSSPTTDSNKNSTKFYHQNYNNTSVDESHFDIDVFNNTSGLIFDLDDVNDDHQSYDDNTDDEDISNQSYQNRPQINGINIARSLPITVPAFLTTRNNDAIEIDEVDIHDNEPVDIAASIKALARSVHGDAIFGDLPRPRFSTQI